MEHFRLMFVKETIAIFTQETVCAKVGPTTDVRWPSPYFVSLRDLFISFFLQSLSYFPRRAHI